MLLAVSSACGAIHPHADVSLPPPLLAVGQPAPALPREGIDVLVWNVEKARRAAWPSELATLVPGKELVLLQEAYLAPRMTESLAAWTELEWRMSPSFAFAWRQGEPTTGVVVGSAARALQSQAFITRHTEPLAGTPKAALAVTYALAGRAELDERLLVVCMHGINFRRAHTLVAQLEALEPVIREHHGPVILAGDLNTHHRARMEAVEEFTARLGLGSAFDNRRAGPRGRAPADGRRRFRGWPLDHVYVRGLVVEDVQVVAGSRGSDHAPLVVRVATTGGVLDPVATPATPASPCTGHDGLVIDPIRPIVSDWQGQVVVGGQAPVVLRWCGEGMVTVASISVVQPATEGSPARALHERVPDPAHERLAHGQSLIVEVHAPARPGLVEVVVLATDEHARPQTARAPLESVEDPARVAHRRECEAAGGHWGPHGMAGVESCDRPTRDAGQRCTSDADCESACIDDGDEPLGASPPAGAEVPSCEPGAQPRLVVGRCSARTLPFGCRARLPRVTIECVAPGIGRRARTICVD